MNGTLFLVVVDLVDGTCSGRIGRWYTIIKWIDHESHAFMGKANHMKH